MSDQPLRAALSELASVMPSDDFTTFLKAVLTDVPIKIRRLREDVQARSPARVSRTAHGLKGSVGMLQHDGLVAICERLESRAASMGPRQVTADIDAIDAAFRRFAPILEDALRGRTAHGTAAPERRR